MPGESEEKILGIQVDLQTEIQNRKANSSTLFFGNNSAVNVLFHGPLLLVFWCTNFSLTAALLEELRVSFCNTSSYSSFPTLGSSFEKNVHRIKGTHKV
jgi:hypothetical protein